MDVIELSIMTRRSVEDTFAFLANLENDVKRHNTFVEMRRMSGDSLGVGARLLVFEGFSANGRLGPNRGLENRLGTSPAKILEGIRARRKWHTIRRLI